MKKLTQIVMLAIVMGMAAGFGLIGESVAGSSPNLSPTIPAIPVCAGGSVTQFHQGTIIEGQCEVGGGYVTTP